MRFYFVFSVFLFTAILFAAPEVEAQSGWGVRGQIAGWCPFGSWLSTELKLTPEQRNWISELDEESADYLAPVIKELEQKRAELRELWSSSHPDEAEILALQRGMEPLREKVRERRIRFRIQVLELLTPKQREVYLRLIRNRPAGFGWGCGCGWKMGWGRGYGRGMGRGRGWRRRALK